MNFLNDYQVLFLTGALVQLSRSKHFLLVTKIFTIKSTKKQGYRHLRPGKVFCDQVKTFLPKINKITMYFCFYLSINTFKKFFKKKALKKLNKQNYSVAMNNTLILY